MHQVLDRNWITATELRKGTRFTAPEMSSALAKLVTGGQVEKRLVKLEDRHARGPLIEYRRTDVVW